ncbi:glycerol-3-phosphate acyltransferase [Algoriphagus ratkowskyi]|uniref:Glycerol-3-phosphate acyltransferase n=1 Tax=Algoriphagus ratkowskyi TaxID=57028 RepID=A0A2W7RYD3_9BACT|nr:1-acyl-sn-glycerol-3-phosphate acyltransferase [Algoriphagus ratkowskyi]PZX60227.1 glycerol-3-phosphate acyltransferase [Algoriphagus ratkowskyi]TXD78052.1 glycerol-3-phosphate acyltransferase [Algoriphagus ratkowskyi]
MEEKYIKHKYEPIHPSKDEWPVVKLARERKEFVKKVADLSEDRILKLTSNNPDILKEELETTLYREKLRIKQNPWVVDPDDDESFWSGVKSSLVQISTEAGRNKIKKLQEYKSILNSITARYAEEIASNFKATHYKFTRSVVTYGFSRLLNAARVKGFKSIFSNQYTLQDKIQITGETDHLRDLATKGTVVMVPTHFSNLDSILIGWVISVLGLPPFIYGAGLNLFNISIFAYFMNSLGAYKVDRRKKNLMYLETLKTYSKEAIQFGCHSLFFPGGTRSRSGMIESRLKLGLLSTAIEAQRANFENGLNDISGKIFIVPVTINYHFVLEAPSLIRDHLSITGQERYYKENDEFSNSYKISKFLVKFFTKGSDISVSVGKAMDVLGNYVDVVGNSLDKKGRLINTRDYFVSGGKVTIDNQREEEYTNMLGKRIVEEFHIINRVFNSHLVAFTAFEIIKKQNRKLDLFDLLRTPQEDITIPYEEFKENCQLVLDKIHELKSQGLINTAPHLSKGMDEIIKNGIDNVGMYHSKRPIIQDNSGDIGTDDMSLLYFYHNRLTGYGLEKLF